MMEGILNASFRDPSGFLFWHQGILYRQVNEVYKENFNHLLSSGLYDSLIKDGLLIPHQDADISLAQGEQAYKVIAPEPVPFISYPYEWCFSQIKDAAHLTIRIQKRAFEFGMSLKDSSAYNIQFLSGRPVLIDTLSFEKYREGEPWVAYKQFCQHFLAPLALMNYTDVRLNQLLRVYIDGIPLDLTSRLLPFSSRLNFGILSHIHLHSKSQKHFADKTVKKKHRRVSTMAFRGLIDSLGSIVGKLKWQPSGTEWADYYEDTNYTAEALAHKKKIISDFLDVITPKMVWDLGANVGLFSRIAAAGGMQTISFDVDPAAVERNYRDSVKNGEPSLLPLLIDLTNPSPGIGWENEERKSLISRGPADTVMALALIHHLAISNNLPFRKISEFLKKICNSLIIEFVPKDDSQIRRLLATREDIFPDYTQSAFESEFSRDFIIKKKVKIENSLRSLYLMVRKE